MTNIIDENLIQDILSRTENPPASKVKDIISKAKQLKGLTLEETAALIQCADKKLIEEIFQASREIKERIYGKRLVLFAPLYLSNECVNNCLYCGFRKDNKDLIRKTLSQEEIAEEVRILEEQGQKRLLLVFGEHPERSNIDYAVESIQTVYKTKTQNGEIRRVNVNMAPLSLEDFKKLKTARIGTYQLFQETYHPLTYKLLHPSGPKRDYSWRITAFDRAMESVIDDVGLGLLFGLYDWRFEVLALLAHAQYLDKKFGVGPHTISVPRIEPALNAPVANCPPYPVSDDDFKKLVAIIRLAVPYTGMILTTREKAELRNELFGLGVSQISAGSRTYPGGYKDQLTHVSAEEQFQIEDTRTPEQIIKNLCEIGYIPSFCTACYRLGRTGETFMDLAKPGNIQTFCLPNALLTFKEYLLDYAKDGAKGIGEKTLLEQLEMINDPHLRKMTEEKIRALEEGQRDLYF